MAKLITHFSSDDRQWLYNRINNPGVYDLPSIEDVIEYLENTDDDDMSEEVMRDLIIIYLEDEGLMFDFC